MSYRVRAQIQAVSIIAFTAVAIILVSVFAYYLKSTGPSLSPIACAEENVKSSISLNYICLDSDKQQVRVNIKRDLTSSEITILDFIISSSKGKATWRCADMCGDCNILNAGEEKTYYLNEIPEGKTSLEILSNGCRSIQFSVPELELC